MKMKLIVTMALLALSSSSNANTTNLNLGIYSKIGLPGFTLGAGYGLNEYVTARIDFSTLGSIQRSFQPEDDLSFQAKFSNHKLNLLFDIFPFTNGFRLTSGMGLLSTELSAIGYSTKPQSIQLGDKSYNVSLDQRDNIRLNINFPKVSPYLGLGYGHHIKQQNGSELGFLFDVGVYLGKPKMTLNISSSLNDKLIRVEEQLMNSGISFQAQQRVNQNVEAEKAKLDKYVNKVSLLPAISLGISYRF